MERNFLDLAVVNIKITDAFMSKSCFNPVNGECQIKLLDVVTGSGRIVYMRWCLGFLGC